MSMEKSVYNFIETCYKFTQSANVYDVYIHNTCSQVAYTFYAQILFDVNTIVKAEKIQNK